MITHRFAASDKKEVECISMANELKLPLNHLRAFEAAARHSSFTQAAAEICVTQSAVSQQIRTLEKRIGCALFERGHQSVTLTREGQMLAAVLMPAFQQIDSAVNAVASRGTDKGAIQILIYPTHARRVLIPRLPRFYALFPDIEVQITSSHWITRAPAGSSIAVRDGFGGWPGVRSVRLHSARLTPVASPAYLEQNPLRRLEDLDTAILLESQNRLDDWPFWRASLPNTMARPERSILFGNSDLAYEAALGGSGVAMGQLALVMGDLRAGRLVAPFPYVASLDRSFFLMVADDAPPHVKTLVDWFTAEVEELERSVDDFIAATRDHAAALAAPRPAPGAPA